MGVFRRDLLERNKIFFDEQLDDSAQAKLDFQKRLRDCAAKCELIEYASHIHQRRDDKPDDNIYRIKTVHNTILFLDPEDKITHQNSQPNQKELIPICARRLKDGIALFAMRDGQEIYYKIDGDRIELSEEPTTTKTIANSDGTFSIEHDGKFLSARRGNGIVNLQPRNLAWEHFTLSM